MCFVEGDGGLSVIVAKGTQTAQCYGPARARSRLAGSCQTILDKMDVSKDEKVFGGRGNVDVVLPYEMYSGIKIAL